MTLYERLRRETQEQRPTKELEQITKDPTATREDKHAARTVLNERKK